MAILSFLVTEPTGVVGDLPRRGKILSTDSYATVTTAGYLNGLNTQGQPINTNDIFDVVYGYVNANSAGTYAQLIASVAAGVVTLTAAGGDVILPVVSGDFAVFSGTTGAIADSGLAPSATGQAYVVTSPGSLTAGQIAEFKDANGTLENSGILATNVMSLAAANAMGAAGTITFTKVNGTEAASAVTASGVAGQITTSSLSTAGGSSYAITWTNTAITATSVVLLTIAGGTNTTENVTLKVVRGAGSATLTIYNNTAATALNGTIIINYLVM